MQHISRVRLLGDCRLFQVDFVFFGDRVFLCAALSVLELNLYTRPALNSRSACLCLLSARTEGVHQHHPAKLTALTITIMKPSQCQLPGGCRLTGIPLVLAPKLKWL